MAYTNQPGTQANGTSGSTMSPSVTNATIQQKSSGANPAMTALEAAAQSYQTPGTVTVKPTTPYNPPGDQPAGGAPNAPGPAMTTPKPYVPPTAFGGTAPGKGGYQTPYGPASEDWLNQLQNTLRDSSEQTMNDQRRALQASMAATPGMSGSGASAAATADLYRRGLTDLQGQLSGSMLDQYGQERNRLAEAWATEGGWATSRDIARMQSEAQMAAASANASAAGAGADLQYKLGLEELALRRELGMGQLDLDRILGIGGLELDQGRLDFNYYDKDIDAMLASMGIFSDIGYDFNDMLDGGGPGWEQLLPPAPAGNV